MAALADVGVTGDGSLAIAVVLEAQEVSALQGRWARREERRKGATRLGFKREGDSISIYRLNRYGTKFLFTGCSDANKVNIG